MQSFRHWRHYFLPKEFIVDSNLQALHYINSKKKSMALTYQVAWIYLRIHFHAETLF